MSESSDKKGKEKHEKKERERSRLESMDSRGGDVMKDSEQGTL